MPKKKLTKKQEMLDEDRELRMMGVWSNQDIWRDKKEDEVWDKYANKINIIRKSKKD